MKTTDNPIKKKKRNCYDRLRKKLLNARRICRADPAASVAVQLLSIFTVFFGRVPNLAFSSSYAPYSPPPQSLALTQSSELARQLEVPRRYLNVVLTIGQVPYATLFEHIRQGGAQRRDALIELRKRIPTASLEWFDYVEKWQLWSELSRCYAPNGSNEETDVNLLKSTLIWLDRVNSENGHMSSEGPTVPKRD
ncbi:hypothetical protein [uncultured Hoeflea sp.]|uniref:hypothetical protein n=1 Tax=uncultured Hoeflea sp. TaxID=538666 RepID=UPI0030EE4EE4